MAELSHAQRVLGAILNEKNPRRDLMGQALIKLSEEHFTVPTDKNLYKFLVRYYDRTGDVMPKDVFIKALQDHNVDAAKVLVYSQQYDVLANSGLDESAFKWSIEELREEQSKRLTFVALTEAYEIAERGYQVGKNFLQGHEAARDYIQSQFHNIDRMGNTETAPEGNIFQEWNSVWDDYVSKKETGVLKGIQSGIPCVDAVTDGWNPGELIMVVAYTGLGKSQIVTQASWSAAVEQGKNVFFATKETLRPQVMRRIIARHSKLPQFDHPINSADIRRGTLTAADEKVMKDVLEDWRYNSNYGQLNIVQVPAHAKLSFVEHRLREYGRNVDVSLCVMDYLALLDPEVKRNSEREEFNDTLKSAKGIAQSFNNGAGIPFVSPWAVTRQHYEAALRNDYYTKAALADTSEAEKSADQIMAILRAEDNNNDMRLQWLKLRDDAIPNIQPVAIDFRYSWIGNLGQQLVLPTSSASDPYLDDLLG